MKSYNPYSANLYRTYRNDFLSPERFAEHIGRPLEATKVILDEGKFSHNLEAAVSRIPNAERMLTQASMPNRVEVFFDYIHSKVYSFIDHGEEVSLESI